MITTIISNNCMGGVICSRNNMEFKSPTVALQILPEEFSKFCANLRHYMECDVERYTDFSEEHTNYLLKMYDGKIPDEFPYGKIDDIIVCFQHYGTFAQAVNKWNERKKRIQWDNIGYILHAKDDRYKKEVDDFLALDLPKSIALTEGFRTGRSYKFDVPTVNGIDAFGWYNGQFVVEGEYHEKEWLKS